MTSYTCPVCFEVHEPAARVGAVAVCPSCGASYVIAEDDQVRRATAVDTTALSEHDLQLLRKARGRVRA